MGAITIFGKIVMKKIDLFGLGKCLLKSPASAMKLGGADAQMKFTCS